MKEGGEEKGSARGSVHWGCYYDTASTVTLILNAAAWPPRGRINNRGDRCSWNRSRNGVRACPETETETRGNC